MWGGFVVGLILVYPVWRIFERAGFSPWFALLVFIPALGVLIVLAMLAFMDWPRTARTHAISPPLQR